MNDSVNNKNHVASYVKIDQIKANVDKVFQTLIVPDVEMIKDFKLINLKINDYKSCCYDNNKIFYKLVNKNKINEIDDLS